MKIFHKKEREEIFFSKRMEKITLITQEKTGSSGLRVPVTSQIGKATAHPVSGPYRVFYLP